MVKNWLLRLKSKDILGPISKGKAIELYKNGSIKPEDELCSGNGYWFYVKEKDLVQRYLLGDEIQSFNIISEAVDVLRKGDHITAIITKDTIQHAEDTKLPQSSDLDYPQLTPDPSDLEYPDMTSSSEKKKE